jgi:hypothetical protein
VPGWREFRTQSVCAASRPLGAFFPTRISAVLPAQGFFASNHSTGPNYNFLARLGYRVAPHVYFDIFGTANNARN